MPGTVLAIYPGEVWFPLQLTPELVKDNEFMIARYDNVVINGKDWGIKGLKVQQNLAVAEYSGTDAKQNVDELKVNKKMVFFVFIYI